MFSVEVTSFNARRAGDFYIRVIDLETDKTVSINDPQVMGTRAAYRAADAQARLMNSGMSKLDANMLSHYPNKSWASQIFSSYGDNLMSCQRPKLFIAADPCEGEGIITDFLTENYAACYGLDCGEEVSEDDLFAHWHDHFEGGEMVMPEYLQDAADRHAAEIDKMYQAIVANHWEGRVFARPVSY